MYPINATSERFEAVEILGIPGLFTPLRVSRGTVPKGMYTYDMQANENNWLQPGLLAQHITAEHYGTVLTASPIALPKSGYLDLKPGDFAQGSGAEQLTIAEFENRCFSRPLARPQRRHYKGKATSHAPCR